MSVFAFLLFFALELVVSGRQDDRRAAGLLALAAALPFAASGVMATISFASLGTACKLCIGIYTASVISLVGAVLLWRRGSRPRSKGSDEGLAREAPTRGEMVSHRYIAGVIGLGFLLVAVPVLAYWVAAPDHSKFVGACGALATEDDKYDVMIPLGANPGGKSAIEILDPLCPACRSFEHRLNTSGLGEKLDRKVLLFPLDNACNWMVSDAIHPGACDISEAVLCAGDRADEVVAWAFEEQDAIKTHTTSDPSAAANMVKQQFPQLASCIGSAEVKSRLNKSLRWAVSNHLPVLTPQLYVEGVKLCDEDVDLGMDFALSRLISGDLGTTPVRPEIDEELERLEQPPPPTAPAPDKHAAPVEPTAVEPAPTEAAESTDAGATETTETPPENSDEVDTTDPMPPEEKTAPPVKDEAKPDPPTAPADTEPTKPAADGEEDKP
jgi:hypothetical protein